MNALHVISGLTVGGAEMMLYKLLSNAEQGSEHVVVSLSRGGSLLPQYRALGIPVYELPMPGGVPRPDLPVSFRRIIAAHQPRIVCSWMYRANVVASACTPRTIPVVWHIRQSLDHSESQRLLFRFTRRVNKSFLKTGPALVLYNSHTSREQHRRFGYTAPHDMVIPNGFDTTRFRPDPAMREETRRQWGVGDTEVVFGIVGRYHPIKNHAGFLRGIAEARRRTPGMSGTKAVRCVMVGRGLDESNTELLREIESCGLEEIVTLLGEQSGLPPLYNGIDILVNSSLVEAFPNVLGEAMSCAVPCVATDVGDSARVTGDTGLIVPPGEMVALGAALGEAWAWSSEERRLRGEAARARVRDRYGVRTVCGEFFQAYRGVIDRAP